MIDPKTLPRWRAVTLGTAEQLAQYLNEIDSVGYDVTQIAFGSTAETFVTVVARLRCSSWSLDLQPDFFGPNGTQLKIGGGGGG